jgi:acyl dehydratase
MILDLGKLGTTAKAPPYTVTREAMAAYARATNDENAEHLSGRLAPPLFAVVPALKTMAALKRQVVEGFTFHGEHELRLQRPIEPGMTLAVEAEVIGIRPSKAGPLVVVRGQTRDQGGALVNEQYLVSVAHGRNLEGGVGQDAPEHRRPPGLSESALLGALDYPVDEDQTLRYAEASGDRDPYTFDHAEARARGLPGAIVHGLCTMAFVGRTVVARCCGGDSRRLKRLAVRFSGLLLLRPGQRLVTRLWRAGEREGRAAVALESDDREGQSVIRHGWAEIGT